jgi:3-keto-5-aminohexanoate cleavage enzyme
LAPDPLIINLAPTGMVPTKATAPHVPLSVDEVLEDVVRCRDLGASVVHLHARDESGAPSHRAELFEPLVAGVREIDPELVVCVTCSGRHVSSLDDRAEVLDLTGSAKPDMASLTLGSNNFLAEPSVNPPDVIRGLAQRMSDRDIVPELETFEPGMLAFGARLASEGLLPERCYVNVLLGNLGTSRLSPASLSAFLAELPEGWAWGLAGLGRFQLDANAMAIAAGGHVRVGLEDNVWFDRERTVPASNPMLVQRVAELAELLERPLASPAEARGLLGLRAAVRS